MIINRANLEAIFWTFDTRYQKAYGLAKPFWNKVASEIPAQGSETHYGWLANLPELREWVGERQVINLAERGYVLANKKFERTVGVPRDKISDDQVGVYANYMDQLGRSAAIWPDKQIALALDNGLTSLCFDGQAFFNNSHPINQDNAALGTYSNRFDVSASGGGVATPLTAPNYNSVRTAMQLYVGDDNNPLGINPNLLIVGPKNEKAARDILHADFIAPAAASGAVAANAPSSNTLKGTADLLVVPWLRDQDRWYLADVSQAILPLIWQVREAPEFTWLNRPDDANVFLRDEYLYGVRARAAAGFSLPFLMASCK